MLMFVEDVGRHNAIDTIAGWMALHGVDGADKAFYTTGRLTSEMVMKSAQMGVPIIVSRNGVTAMGHDLACKLGMALFGRAANRHFLCYTGFERFDSEPEPQRAPAAAGGGMAGDGLNSSDQPVEQPDVDRSPAATEPCSCPSTTSALASLMLRRMPAPCEPVRRTCQPPSAPRLDDAALELGAAGALAHRARAAGLQHRQGLGRGAGQLQQRLAREGVEGHECGHRVAGQREQPALPRRAVDHRAQRAEGERPAGTHRHLPERHLAHARQQLARVVGVADADAAAGQHHVGLRQRGVQRGLQRGRIVAHQAEVDDLHAQPLQRAARLWRLLS
jgi:hypothetical protein